MPGTPIPYNTVENLPAGSPARVVVERDKQLRQDESNMKVFLWIASITGILAVVITFGFGNLIHFGAFLFAVCVFATIFFHVSRTRAGKTRKFYEAMSQAVAADTAAGTVFTVEERAVFEPMAQNVNPTAAAVGGGLLTTLLIVVLIVFLPMRLEYESDGDEAGATRACQQVISRQLKEPSSASFSSSAVANNGRREWIVRGIVEGANSFGVMNSASYICSVTWDGSRYRVIGSINE